MVKKVKPPTQANSTGIEIRLSDPGMTALHKAGLAGLWMTLKAFEGSPEIYNRFQGIGASWERGENYITLHWQDQDAFLKMLFEEAYKLDENGLVWFAAIGEPTSHMEHAIVLQEAVLSTFLQHNQNRKVSKEAQPVTISIDDIQISMSIKPIESYEHQSPRISSNGYTELAGWLSPGGGDRHLGLSGTKLEETLPRALCLSFTPQGSIYFKISRRSNEVRKSAFALVIPEINSLEVYARARAAFIRFGTCQLRASGASDAGLRAMVVFQSVGMLDSIQSPSCRVMVFGSIPWSGQQKTRVDLLTIRTVTTDSLKVFGLALKCFPTQVVQREGKSPFIDTPQMPELIAANLEESRPWWKGFASFIEDTERREHIFNYERFGPKFSQGGISQMVNDPTTFPDSPERVFVKACHTAWKARLGQIGARARTEGASFKSIASREFEHLRVTFSRCKNAASLREAVTDFWARAGRIPELQDAWDQVLPLISEERWREGRDLALLALASYKPASKAEEEALSESTSKTNEGVEEQ